MRSIEVSKRGNLYHKFNIFFVLFGRLNGDYYESDVVFIAVIIFSCLGIVFLLRYKTYKSYYLWQIALLSLMSLSILWAYDVTITKTYIIAIFGRLFPLIYICMYIRTDEDFYTVMNLFVFSSIIVFLYLIFIKGIMTFVNLRLIEIYSTQGWNCNRIGIMASFTIYYCIFLIGLRKSLQLKKIFWIIAIFISLVIVVLSGSKKTYFITFAVCGIYFILSKKNKISKTIFVFLAISALYYLITTVPFLYEIAGSRVESLLEGLTANDITLMNASDRLRMHLIDNGWEWFKEKPMIGYGMAGFVALFRDNFGRAVYSHNNYIELLVGLGIVGTLCYYAGYFYILIYSLKGIRNRFGKFSLSIIITILVVEYGVVSYLVMTIQIAIIFCFYTANSIKKELHKKNECQHMPHTVSSIKIST